MENPVPYVLSPYKKITRQNLKHKKNKKNKKPSGKPRYPRYVTRRGNKKFPPYKKVTVNIIHENV